MIAIKIPRSAEVVESTHLVCKAPAFTVTASMGFLKPSPLYDEQKLYQFQHTSPDLAIPQTNIEYEQHDGVQISDIRGREDLFSIKSDGFTVLRQQSELKYEDFYRETCLPVYFSELESLLKSHLGASRVKVFRHVVRKRHVDFPVSTGEKYPYDQPASIAHLDTTIDGTLREVERQYSIDAQSIPSSYSRVQWVNVWKPLRGPLNDYPLALVSTPSIIVSKILPADLLTPTFISENAMVYHDPNYEWHYLSDHNPDELMVFVQADTGEGAMPGVIHSSFYNPNKRSDEPPRESIEVRALVFYD